MLCCILYVVASYVILSFRKALKEIIKVMGHSLFYSLSVILTSLQSKPDSPLSSEKSFSTPGDKIKFCVLELRSWLFNYGLHSPSADRLTQYYR